MKYLLLLILAFPSFAARPPEQGVVDHYVNLALQLDPEKVQAYRASWSCQQSGPHGSYAANGKNPKEAETLMLLMCIKDQCNKLGHQVLESAKKLKEMPEQDLYDFLEFSGHSKEEIEQKIRSIKNSSPESMKPQNCQTGTPIFRMTAFDTCFSVPLECGEN